MNILHDELNNFKYYYVDMNFDFHEEHKDRRDRNKSLIKLILDKVNHESLDMTIALNLSCRYGLLDFVTFVLENTDHKLLDFKKATSILYDAWERNYSYSTIEEIKDMRDQYEKLIKLIIEKVKHDSLDLQILLNLAFCCYSLDVVTLMLEKQIIKC
ncbi:unnamed protein product [Mytilus edulis]|uniref:Uncharacterized protein n=1 Tax=Mytilus edulis TaxID=6550 RepID=A0A8S3UYZ1_MYTED|nr:unnamed protein product [Mytilus edulis]